MVRELGTHKDEFFTGSYTVAVIDSLEALVRAEVIRRLWSIDPNLFTSDADSAKLIPNRMGWLRAPEFIANHAGSLQAFAKQTRAAGYDRVLVVGFGGSIVGPAALLRSFPPQNPGLELQILDTIEPAVVRSLVAWADPKRTLFVMISKDGSEIEFGLIERHLFEHCRSVVGGAAGHRFVAITDPESELGQLARKRQYQRIFENPPDIGARYSPMTYAGVVPAALAGVDVDALTLDAAKMGEACSPAVAIEENPGFRLGSFIAGLSAVGRDKLTILLSHELLPFGRYLEHVVAESTGRKKRGMVPIVGEPVGSAEVYGNDRIFVYMRLENSKRSETDELVASLISRGEPVAKLTLTDRSELGGEVLRWQLATVVVAASLRLNPFDEQGGQMQRAATLRFLEAYRQSGVLPPWHACGPTSRRVLDFAKKLKRGHYLAIQAFVPPTDKTNQTFFEIRRFLRSKLGVCTLQGYGIEFMHASAQFCREGPPEGALLIVSAGAEDDLQLAGEELGVGVIAEAHMLGEQQLLQHGGRSVLRVNLGSDVNEGLAQLAETLREL